MVKLQADLDLALENEKKVMAAAEEFMETGKIPDENFFPDLSRPTQKVRREYREGISAEFSQAIFHGQVDLAKKIEAALEAGGIEGWRVKEFDTDGYVDKIVVRRLSPKQGRFTKVSAPSIRSALRNSIEAYYAAWNDNQKADPKKRARLSARAALKVFYEFDGSELPKNLKLHEETLFDPDFFKKVVAFDHKDYVPPLRARGTQLDPFQIKVGEELGEPKKRSWNGKKKSGSDPPSH